MESSVPVAAFTGYTELYGLDSTIMITGVSSRLNCLGACVRVL